MTQPTTSSESKMTYSAPAEAPAAIPSGTLKSRSGDLLSRNALFVIWIGLVILFWQILPGTFLSKSNINSTITLQSVPALLAFGAMIPLIADQFDVSIGYLVGLVNIFTLKLIFVEHVSWPLVVVLMIVLGAFVGLFNGLVVTKLRIHSFIATLASGTVLYSVGLWYSQGQEITGVVPPGFQRLSGQLGGIPLPAIYVAVVAIVLWGLLEYTLTGRRLYVIGSSVQTAKVVGVRTDRYIVASFVASSVLVACGGVVLASLLQSASSNTGPEYLLPAFAAVFLGSTAVRPGRINILGTLLALLVLATIVNGFALKGFASWIQPLFNGLILIVAVGASGYLLRRREAGRKLDQIRSRLSNRVKDIEE